MQVQSDALNLKDYSFSGQEAIQILNNLLKTRIDDLESSSVRDVVGIIKTLSDTGALDTGDSGFSRHFVTIPKKYDCICPRCNHEQYLVEGVDNKCTSCGMVLRWDNGRFYPQPTKL